MFDVDVIRFRGVLWTGTCKCPYVLARPVSEGRNGDNFGKYVLGYRINSLAPKIEKNVKKHSYQQVLHQLQSF